MTTTHTIDASNFEERTVIFPAIFAKAVNRFKQINIDQESLDEVNSTITKKVEPSLSDREDKIWAQWKDLTEAA